MTPLYDWIFKSKNLEEIKVRTFLIFTVVGFIFSLIYSAVGFIQQNFILAAFDLFFAVSIIVLGYISYKNKNLKIYEGVGLLPIFTFGMFNFLNGGLAGVAIYWTFILPILAFFLSSIRMALITNFIYIVAAITIHILSKFLSFKSLYSDGQMVTYFFSFGAIVLLSLLFKEAWDLNNTLVEAKQIGIEKYTKELEINLDELNKTKLQLEESNSQTQRINKVLLDRELAMIKLKNRVNHLEEELIKEREK